MPNYIYYNQNYLRKNFYWPPKGLKHSINSPFLKADFPLLNRAQAFASVKDLILKDSWPFNTSTSKVPLLFITTLLFKNNQSSNLSKEIDSF